MGVLPRVSVSLCVIQKTQQWGGLGPSWAVALQKGAEMQVTLLGSFMIY